MNLEFFVKNKRLTRKGLEPLVGDTAGHYTFTVEFDREWDGLVKVVVFRNGQDTAELIYTGQSPLPAQVSGRGDLYVACHGYRKAGDTVAVVRTIRMTRPVRLLGSEPMAGSQAERYTPTVYEQVLAAAGEAKTAAAEASQTAQQLRQLRDSGAFHGQPGAAATICVAGTQVGATPSVVNLGTASDAKLLFTLPQADGGSAYTLPVATSEILGGVKPVAKTDEMTQKIGVDADGALYTKPGADAFPAPETAEVGQTIVVAEVDENGKPTAWEAVDFPSGDSSRKVSLPLNEEGAPDYGTVGYYAVSDGAGGITWVAAGNTGGSGDSGETTYGIVWDLVNVTSSNSVASVKDGASLSAVLTPADGYTLGDVIVTMGGEVVTGVWNADTATVTIATVTGDVVISCAGVRVETVHLPFLGYTQDAMKAEYTYHEWVEKILTGSLQYAWFGGAINGAGTFYVEWPEDAFELVDKNGTETTGFPKGILVLYDADGNFLSGLTSDGTLLFENGIWSETAFTYLNMKGTASFSVTVDNTDAKYLLFTMRANAVRPDGYAETNAGFATWASENANVTFTSGAATAVEESVAQAVDAEYQQNYEVSTLSLTSNTQTDTTTFEGVLEQAKNAWMLEYGGNVNKLPVIIHTDQHGWLANGQTIGDVFDTISGMVNWYDISKVINLGDTANSYDNPDDLTAGSTTLENYLDAMSEVPYSKRIEIFGNHDLAYFVDGVLTFIDSEQSYLQPYFRNIFARKTNNNGYFVVKDDNFNVKYVVISGFEVDKEIGNGNGYIMSGKQIAWMIEELQKADGYDVIILSHVPLWKRATETNPIDGTTSSTSYSVDAAIDMDALYAARKNKTSGSVTDRYGITHDYDFSNCNGELLCSLHGHNHSDGYAYTGDSVLSATFQNFYASPRCLYLVLVDRSNRQLNVWKVDSTPQYQNYQIPLDKPAE